MNLFKFFMRIKLVKKVSLHASYLPHYKSYWPLRIERFDKTQFVVQVKYYDKVWVTLTDTVVGDWGPNPYKFNSYESAYRFLIEAENVVGRRDDSAIDVNKFKLPFPTDRLGIYNFLGSSEASL